MWKVYAYKKCSTCQKAFHWLQTRSVDYEEFAIREHPPSLSELKQMLRIYDGNIRKLFNTSGQDYRALKLGDRLDSMSIEEALHLLSKNGNLVKRPFVLNKEGLGAVGFREEAWRELLK